MKLLDTRSHKGLYEENMSTLDALERKLDLHHLESLSVNELSNLLSDVKEKFLQIEHPAAAECIFGMAVSFPHTYVRYVLIDVVRHWIPYSSAVETMVRLTHDPDDLVSFKAM